ncbi:Coenzyme F420 hydrogenase/dehydrogenase, beta subunit C-terminal domain [Opitutales bacterium]|nr:Coenzyme F420 hydrogenase/dehydrogenase, beta subunit C-terminal domain [Opitutales bacterium]
MKSTSTGPLPNFDLLKSDLPPVINKVCPALNLDYIQLYKDLWNQNDHNPITGKVMKLRTGYVSDNATRKASSSGGVITLVISHLLITRQIDAVITVRQGMPTPLNARVTIIDDIDELKKTTQSVYIPVSVLDILRDLDTKKKYAITCLPDQAAALRKLQVLGNKKAKAVKYVLGPYTGTAIYPNALKSFLKSNGVSPNDHVKSLKWRAGEWPGHLEIKTDSGKVLKSPKVYYNYLIPFFITQNSLQNMDFVNEFCDLSVGDAWSPEHEKLKGGQSVFVTRTEKMEKIIQCLINDKELIVEEIDPMKASEMHGHMIDFKKRGAYIRNQFRRLIGLKAPDFGMRPEKISFARWIMEIVIISIFFVGKTKFARWIITIIPQKILGMIFNNLRLYWKSISKPTKRKGLNNLKMIPTTKRL